jgi:hypothetical protein
MEVSNGRFNRAIGILVGHGQIKPDGEFPGRYLVTSCRDSNKFYEVDHTAKTCTCPDDRQAREKNIGAERICKHRLAVGLALYGPEFVREADKIHRKRLYEARSREEDFFQAMCKVIDEVELFCVDHAYDNMTDELRQRYSYAVNQHQASMEDVAQIMNEDEWNGITAPPTVHVERMKANEE